MRRGLKVGLVYEAVQKLEKPWHYYAKLSPFPYGLNIPHEEFEKIINCAREKGLYDDQIDSNFLELLRDLFGLYIL